MAEHNEMHSFKSRLHTFEIAHQLSKRRASSQTSSKKKGGNSVEWPHAQPAPDELARAGFFYRPAEDSADNVQCFLCSVKLDGWEPTDDPLKEHLAHVSTCHWAQSLSAGTAAQQESTAQDPLSEDLVAARRGTFEVGAGWPHENKRGWKCKIAKMVEAGWCLDPAPMGEDEEGDGVTCFYCNLSLDGWEPKDDPFEEHRRRSPDCAFFALVGKYVGASAGKKTKGKGRGKAASRTSTASKASRLSTQSVQSTFSEAPSLADLGGAGTDAEAGVDDSTISTASQATITGPTKGKKKAVRPKAAAKDVKGRKRAGTVDSEADAGSLYPDLSAHVEPQPSTAEAVSVAPSQSEPAAAPAKKTRKGTRQSKQPLDSSVIEISSLDVAPTKKPARGKKAKPQPEPQADADMDADFSEVSAQLQEELERSMDMDMEPKAEESTPQPEPAKAKRGVKRTSDGFKKKDEAEAEAQGASIDEFPLPPAAAPVPKAKRGRKPSKQVVTESGHEQGRETQDEVPVSESEAEPAKQAKSKKAPAKKGGRGKKASSTGSSRSSRATVIADSEPAAQEPEDLERDEREIEAELQRIADEQAMQAEQDKVAEFEPSPSHNQEHVEQMRRLEEEVRREAETTTKGNDTPRKPAGGKENATPSPNGSDKENQPSSTIPPSGKRPVNAPPTVVLSPTKTTRVPLAPGTPNRLSPSKSRTLLLSPSKQISRLTSSRPWEAIDLDTILLASPQPTPGTLAQRLAGAAVGGALTSPEKTLTVEEWVRWQAEKGEKELRRRCEEMVGAFETEGLRGLACLEGIPVVST